MGIQAAVGDAGFIHYREDQHYESVELPYASASNE